MVEDAEDLCRTVVGAHRVGNHRGEFCRLARLDQDGPLAQEQHNGSRQDSEPVLAGMDPQFVGATPGLWPGDTHLGHGYAVRSWLPAQHPGGHPPHHIAVRPDHHIVVIHGLHQLVEGGPQGPGDQGQLVEGDPPVAGLNTAKGGSAQVAASSQVVKRPALGHTQSPDPLTDQTVEIAVLRHTQETMPLAQSQHMVRAWKIITTSTIPQPSPTGRPWPSFSTWTLTYCTPTFRR